MILAYPTQNVKHLFFEFFLPMVEAVERRGWLGESATIKGGGKNEKNNRKIIYKKSQILLTVILYYVIITPEKIFLKFGKNREVFL